MLDHIFARYDAVLVLDTETTGISCRKDEIIELAVLKAGQDEAGLCELETMDEFIRLSEGRHLPEKIAWQKASSQDHRAHGHYRADAAGRRNFQAAGRRNVLPDVRRADVDRCV